MIIIYTYLIIGVLWNLLLLFRVDKYKEKFKGCVERLAELKDEDGFLLSPRGCTFYATILVIVTHLIIVVFWGPMVTLKLIKAWGNRGG